uniref:Solute-binding protein family 5 domain-containing protein n=1 Tax=Fervidicoccus fontis TaxID=683846 RepID=A0A7J3ZJ08_9CREN
MNKLTALMLFVLLMTAPLALAAPIAAEEEADPNWVPITELTPKIVADERFQFNPLGVAKIRQALSLLMDREFIVDNVYEGSAEPMLSAVRPTHPGREMAGLEAIEEEFRLLPAGNIDRALQLYNEAIEELNGIYAEYGFKLVFKTDEKGNKWLYFVKPDGTEQQVKIYFIIRTEDERLQVGRQVAEWIEKYFHIKVERIERERGVVTPIIYGTNPASLGFKEHPWHIYTEGWVAVGEDLPYWVRYDVAFFCAPLKGYGPNHRVKDWWYYYDPVAYELGEKLYYGTYTPDMLDQLWEDVRELFKVCLRDSLRAGVVNNLEFFMVNVKDVTIPFYGKQTGLWSVWGLRTATAKDGVVTALELSSTGALFMSPWNPVLGFNDVYSQLIWSQVHSFGMYPHYETAVPIKTTADYDLVTDYTVSEGGVAGNLVVPDTAIVFDPVESKWITIKEAIEGNKAYIPGVQDLIVSDKKVTTKVTFNYMPIKWHYDAEFSVFDVLASMAFAYEWSFDDSEITGQPDPYYDSEYASQVYSMLALVKGVEVINDTALAIYSDYLDVAPEVIVYSLLWYATVPFDLLASMEYAVVTDPGGTNYGWATRAETGETGIDMLIHSEAIKQSAEALLKEGAVYYFNGLEDLGISVNVNVADRLNKLISWIDSKGHAVVSNGPFYVETYDPNANYLLARSIVDLGFPKIKYVGIDIEVPNVNAIEFKSVTSQEAGIEAVKTEKADVFLHSLPRGRIGEVPGNIQLIPASTIMTMLAFNPVSNVYDPTKPGSIELLDKTLSGQVIPGLVLYEPQKVLQEYAAVETVPPTEMKNVTPITPPPTQAPTEGGLGAAMAVIIAVIAAIIIAATVVFLRRK